MGQKFQTAGAVFFAKSTQRFLFLLRDDTSFKNTWAFVGGKIDAGERTIDGLYREISEEIGSVPDIEKLIPIDQFTNTKKGFEYHTFIAVVEDEFIPKLNQEHKGYAWTKLQGWPEPLHPGVFSTVKTQEIADKIATVVALFRSSTQLGQ